MERVIRVFGSNEIITKPEILFYYGAVAVMTTLLVNWTMTTLLVLLKPFTCAAILVSFIRPDLVQILMQEEYLTLFSDKTKAIFSGILSLLLKVGQQFRPKN